MKSAKVEKGNRGEMSLERRIKECFLSFWCWALPNIGLLHSPTQAIAVVVVVAAPQQQEAKEQTTTEEKMWPKKKSGGACIPLIFLVQHPPTCHALENISYTSHVHTFHSGLGHLVVVVVVVVLLSSLLLRVHGLLEVLCLLSHAISTCSCKIALHTALARAR